MYYLCVYVMVLQFFLGFQTPFVSLCRILENRLVSLRCTTVDAQCAIDCTISRPTEQKTGMTNYRIDRIDTHRHRF